MSRAPADLQARFARVCSLPCKLSAADSSSGSVVSPSAVDSRHPSAAAAEGSSVHVVRPCWHCDGAGGRVSDWGMWLPCDECEGTGRDVRVPMSAVRGCGWLREFVAEELSVKGTWLQPEQLDALCAIAERLEQVARETQELLAEVERLKGARS